MSPSKRAALVVLANESSRLSRRGGAPRLTPESSRETLLAWLQWNDRNGVYLDHLAIADGAEPMSLDEAWTAISEVEF
jgi:hypothetical protein